MIEVEAFEAKNTLSQLLDRVEKGEEVVITRHGKAVARLVPDTSSVNPEQVLAAAQRIRARAASLTPAPFDWQALKADRDTGRP